MILEEYENDVLLSLYEVVKDTLNYDEELLLIGRENATQDTFTKNYIVLDTLASNPVSQPLKKYDDVDEIEYWHTNMVGTFTLEFYGTKGRINYINFLNLINSQECRDAQKANEIVIFLPKNTNNLKMQTQSKFYERYEVEVVIQYVIKTAVERLRIDTADINYLIER
ncbi:phage neck terminator protein [Aliarcobacter butzleri]|uniref:phage neck terminator protein n=1 Tax=Aliarcobacter butzleri TaxID=28197 RepID=UPI003B226470